jgi:hypothetical protein
VIWRLKDLQVRALGEAALATRQDDTGYTVEARIPWKSLAIAPEPGLTLGIAASVSDNDTPDTAVQECMISTAPQRDWQRPLTWGTLVLGTVEGGY